jgi:phosphoglycolate phosphatase
MKDTALVFDLDGTLVDSLPDLHAAVNEMPRELHRPTLTPAQVRPMIGDGSRALVERALAATGPASDLDAAYDRFLPIYEARSTRLSHLYPGVPETLAQLKAAGARLGICTNKPQTVTVAVLESFGIATCFDAVLCGDVVPFRKPDPRHLLSTIEQLHAAPRDAVMIGDSENDYAAARGASIPVILMRYGYLRVPPETLSPDAWLDRFADIPQTVANWLPRRKTS